MDVLARRVGIELVQPLDRRHALLDRAGVVLREVADRHLVAPAHRAGVEVARRRRQARRVREQRLEQRRLADAVAADEHDLLAAVDDGAEVRRSTCSAAVAPCVTPLHSSATLARRPVHLEPDVRALDVRPRQLGRLQPLDFLAARRHLARARAGARSAR